MQPVRNVHDVRKLLSAKSSQTVNSGPYVRLALKIDRNIFEIPSEVQMVISKN